MSTQTPDPRQWCDDLQIKLMAAVDAAWRIAEAGGDPAEVAKALAKARLCGQFAATARKIVAMTPTQPRRKATAPPAAADARFEEAGDEAGPDLAPTPQAAIARAALERLRAGGGRRGRL